MPTDPFEERLARVRQRFALALAGKVNDSFAALPHLYGDAPEVMEALAVTYRRLHEMCGIAPTLGFGATGKAARAAETVLLEAYKNKRGLSTAELASLKSELGALQAAAQSELQSMSTRG